jgi:WhiB family redox-sensing transcriptional regulator
MSWVDQAACKGMDSTIFFAERGDTSKARQARKICATCPVKQPCLQFALDNNEKIGYWGGTTPRQRRSMKQRAALLRKAS